MAADRVSVHRSAELWREEVLTELLKLEDLVVANPNTKREMKSGIAKLAGLLRKLTISSTTEVGTAPESFQAPNSQSSKFLERETVCSSPRLVVSRDTTILVCGGATVTLKQESKPVSSQRRVSPGPSTSQEEEGPSTAEWRTVQRKRHNKKLQPATASERTSGTSTIHIPTILGRNDRRSNQDHRKNSTQHQEEEWMTVQRRRRKGLTTLEIDIQNQCFSEALEKMRKNLNLSAENQIQSIKEKPGKMVIKAKGDPKTLLEEVQKASELQVKERSRPIFLIVRNMDQLTTKEEIQKALMDASKAPGIYKEEVEVTSLRNAYGGTQKATVKVSKRMAEDILVAGKVKIGLVVCPVSRQEQLVSCFRCWETGHRARQCKGPDRSNLCYKCGDEGHKAGVCTAEQEGCTKCHKKGHRTNRCPEERKRGGSPTEQ
jgi:hypothetical protein